MSELNGPGIGYALERPEDVIAAAFEKAGR